MCIYLPRETLYISSNNDLFTAEQKGRVNIMLKHPPAPNSRVAFDHQGVHSLSWAALQVKMNRPDVFPSKNHIIDMANSIFWHVIL